MGFIFYYNSAHLCGNSYTTRPNIEDWCPFLCKKITYCIYLYVVKN
jgi:hypothetical protein